MNNPTICVGAGPAGLSAAYTLAKAGVPVTVLERDPIYVGGIAKTFNYRGFLIDLGGHRFFSRSEEISNLWQEILPDGFIPVGRLSRIYYNGRFFRYPLEPINVFTNLGLRESLRCFCSFISARLRPVPNPQNIKDWVSNRFGIRLFSLFFKTYTEKVWGVPCEEISADWAAQRIRNLSLGGAIRDAITPGFLKRRANPKYRSLVTSFSYPRRGPGMFWDALANRIENLGGRIVRGAEVRRFRFNPQTKTWLLECVCPSGAVESFAAAQLVITAPLAEVIEQLEPQPACLEIARTLRYRDFVLVALIVRTPTRLADNWLYIHEPRLKVGRVQNYRAWSPEMAPAGEHSCFGMEYFCFENDHLWKSDDQTLIRMAAGELQELKLLDQPQIIDGCVIRQPKAYPFYDAGYREKTSIIRAELKTEFPGLHLAGRSGLHRYDNQDHAMMTGILAARNIIAGKELFDPWLVNQDAVYHEEGEDPRAAKDSLG